MKTALVLALLVAYAWLTHERVKVWRNDFTLWEDAARKAPCLTRPHTQLALYLERHGESSALEWSEVAKRSLMPCGTY